MAELTWARKWIEGQRIGYAHEQPGDVLESGAVVLVEAVSEDADGKAYEAAAYGLRQIPKVNGGQVAPDAHTGSVQDMAELGRAWGRERGREKVRTVAGGVSLYK